MAEGPIPWEVIDRYAEAHGIAGDLRDDLFHHVRALDDAYLKHREEKSGG